MIITGMLESKNSCGMDLFCQLFSFFLSCTDNSILLCTCGSELNFADRITGQGGVKQTRHECKYWTLLLCFTHTYVLTISIYRELLHRYITEIHIPSGLYISTSGL